MARRNTGAPSYEPKPVRPARPDDRPGLRGAAPVAVGPKPPVEKPHRALQAVGFQGGISEFNNRLQQAHDAHLAAKGFVPSPGLALDVARSKVPTDAINPSLFGGAGMLGAAARKAILNGSVDRTLVENPSQHLLDKYKAATATGQYKQFWEQHGDEVEALQKTDPQFATKFATLNAQGFGLSPAKQATGLGKILTIGMRGAGQVTEGLVFGTPTLAFEEGKAIGHSVEQKSLKPLGKTNVKLAKGVVEGVVRDVRDPAGNPGYLFLDVFGALSLGAGAGVRVATAGKALARGELKQAARNAVERPRGGRIEMRKGDAVEERLGSQNMLVNAAQRLNQKWDNHKMSKRSEGEPAGTLTIFPPGRARGYLEAKFEPLRMRFGDEAKFRRERDARARVQTNLSMSLKQDIEAVSGWSERTTMALGRLPQKMRRGLSVGEQKALQVLTLDDPDPLNAWRSFHERMIAQQYGDVSAHQAHLAALKLAEKALAKPSKRFKKAVALMYEAVNEMEQLKMEKAGLTPEIGERRVIAAGQVVRSGHKTTAQPADPYISLGQEFVGSLPDQAREKGYLYHRTSADRFEQIKKKGLLPAKPEGNPEGVYFANGPLEADGLAWKHKNSVYLRVAKGSVPDREERAFGESRTSNEVPASAIEYLGKDGKWHPLGGMPTERLSPHSLYVPFMSKVHTPRRGVDNGRAPQLRDSGYGVGPVQGLSEMKHEFTGEAIRLGTFRWDTTNLVAESYGRTVRFAAKLDQHRSIWDAASDVKRGPFDRPVRDMREIPDALRELMQKADEGLLTEKDATTLKSSEIEKLNEFLYPEHPVPGVRWFDPGLLEIDHAPIASVAKAVAQGANEIIRVPTLFLRPAYILNAVGNTGMALLEQGHHFPPNILRAASAGTLYGERIARKLDALAGQSKSKSFVNEKNLFGVNAVGRALAQGWSRVADDLFRRSAVIHELRRLDYDLPLRKLTREEQANWERILSSKATPKEAADVVEASRRGQKAMVEFDNQTWVEREILKQVIFVYPWVSRSLVWSVRSVIEHPVKAAILAQIGADEQEQHKELSEKVPSWFKNGGYIPVGVGKDGNPLVINSTSVNSWSSLSQIQNSVTAGFIDGAPGTEFDSAFGMLGPMAKFLVRGITGRDDYGNPYPGSDWFSAAKDVLDDLPQVAAVKRSRKENPELSPVDLAKRDTLMRHYKSALHRTVFSPGWADGFGMLVTGGLTPREVDKGALQARYWQDLTPEKRHTLEKRFLRDALKEQSDFLLKRKVPDEVREAVDLASEMTWKAVLRSKELGRTVPTGTLERTLLDIDTLAANHRIPKDDIEKLKRTAKKAETKEDQRRFHSALLDKYAGGKALHEWDDAVRFVASFTKENLQARLHVLGGLSEVKRVTADQETLYEAGRQALAYRDKIKQLREEAKDLPRLERDVKLAELRKFVDEQDKPIRVNGKTVAPSPVRLDWAQTSKQDREDTVRSLVRRSWGSMTNFEKEIVGRKVPEKVSAAWAIIAKLKAEYKRDNYTTPTADQIYGLVKQMDKQGYAGILQDYIFSVQPKIRRLEVLKPFKDLPTEVRNDFYRVVGNDAKKAAAAIASGDYNSTDVRQAWTNYVTGELQQTLAQQEHMKLRAWLGPFGPDFLSGLIGR